MLNVGLFLVGLWCLITGLIEVFTGTAHPLPALLLSLFKAVGGLLIVVATILPVLRLTPTLFSW